MGMMLVSYPVWPRVLSDLARRHKHTCVPDKAACLVLPLWQPYSALKSVDNFARCDRDIIVAQAQQQCFDTLLDIVCYFLSFPLHGSSRSALWGNSTSFTVHISPGPSQQMQHMRARSTARTLSGAVQTRYYGTCQNPSPAKD